MIRRTSNLLLLMAGIALGIFILMKWNVLPSFKDIFSAKPVVIDKTPILIKEIKQLGELVSITIYDEVVIDSLKLRPPTIAEKIISLSSPIPVAAGMGADELVLVAKGRVIAGTDLQKLTPQDIFIQNDSVSLKLPAAEILEVISNPSDIETFSEKGSWAPDEVAAVKNSAKRKLLQRATEKNILPKANNQAVLVMAQLLKTAGFKKVNVWN